ncbi:MAG TPA: helix-hairpin-helix domain-containing protein [Granulicella sp.]
MMRLHTRVFTLLFSLLTVGAPMAAHAQSLGQALSSKVSSVADANKIDINTATPDQLKSLKGLGDAYTKRIIDGRPYTAKNQLVTRGIIPSSAYNGIKDLIVARAPKK